MKKSKKFLIITSSATLLTGGAIASISALVIYNKGRQTNSNPDKFDIPIQDINQNINIYSPENINLFHQYFLDFFDSQTSYKKMNFYINSYKLKSKIEEFKEKTFYEILKSQDCQNLVNENDDLIIKEKFLFICNDFLNYFSINLANSIKWDPLFVSILVNPLVSDSEFETINKMFLNSINEEFFEKEFLKEFELNKSNEKLKWLLDKTNTGKQELNKMAKMYAKSEVNDYKKNMIDFQNFFVKKITNISDPILKTNSNYQLNFFSEFTNQKNLDITIWKYIDRLSDYVGKYLIETKNNEIDYFDLLKKQLLNY